MVISILDYGQGNIGSLQNMLKKLNAKFKVITDIEGIKNADAIILPGVGAFDTAITNLKSLNAIDELKEKIIIKR